MSVQEELGPDIAMVLDVCIGLPAPAEAVAEAMERTLRWAERSVRARSREDQALFGIVQGGADPDLRFDSARRTAELDVDGFGIGGLSVGEDLGRRNESVEAAVAGLPAGAPRYFMGLGDMEGLLEAIARGVDLFDCVWPTRLARHGKVITGRGDYNIPSGPVRRRRTASRSRLYVFDLPHLFARLPAPSGRHPRAVAVPASLHPQPGRYPPVAAGGPSRHHRRRLRRVP